MPVASGPQSGERVDPVYVELDLILSCSLNRCLRMLCFYLNGMSFDNHKGEERIGIHKHR